MQFSSHLCTWEICLVLKVCLSPGSVRINENVCWARAAGGSQICTELTSSHPVCKKCICEELLVQLCSSAKTYISAQLPLRLTETKESQLVLDFIAEPSEDERSPLVNSKGLIGDWCQQQQKGRRARRAGAEQTSFSPSLPRLLNCFL